ncbi:hypothetical protein [Actinacidiphila acidipaludis]|uniref:Zinc-finger domain-containing protein n=1 Tax=Actinacidiphila acidipaludis TaxID=2873382 RepID=A0ABS7QIR7_9ACTN|nr:hypothetical protein [Streptomyces acidipaludis]MBY8882574.1 hypothetical protein [Streptomyces acidipaludis]
MNESSARIEHFLHTDPRDVGCDQAMEMLHVYVDLAANGQNPHERYPGMAAHLQACGPCDQDFEGLLAAVTGRPGG